MRREMKNKSKPTLFAAVVLHALLLIMPGSAWAAAEDDQEIGVPQAMEAPAKVVKGCFGAVLSPDTNRFYTVGEGSLTQYPINPFRKIGSLAIDSIDWKYFGERKYGGPQCRVLMTNDKSKLIIVYYDQMFLLDVRTGQILNKFERTDLARGFDAATLNDNDLLILETFQSQGFYILTIRDADTLKLKREIHLGKHFGLFPKHGWVGMSKIQNRVYLENARYFVVLNSKTYAPELTVTKYIPELAVTQAGIERQPKISKNFKKLYRPDVLKVTDHLNGKQATYDDVRGDNFLVFDQETRHASIENMKNISRDEFDPGLVHRDQLSRNKEYVMRSDGSGALAILANLNTGMRFRFYQYESGEAILFESLSDGVNTNFKITPGARKYLLMKNSEGKIVPINDATFNKYYRSENKR